VRFGDLAVLDSTFPPYPSAALDKRLFNYINNLDLSTIPPGIVSISTTNGCPYSCAFCSTNSRTRTENFTLPVRELSPLKELFARAGAWAENR
jgi:radical SAM superfamily enzyme YgiQ (UPF0313 family)